MTRSEGLILCTVLATVRSSTSRQILPQGLAQQEEAFISEMLEDRDRRLGSSLPGSGREK